MSILYSELGYKAICCEIQSVYSCITKVIKCYAENCCSEVNNNIYHSLEIQIIVQYHGRYLLFTGFP